MGALTIIDKGLADYATLAAGLPEGSEILWLDNSPASLLAMWMGVGRSGGVGCHRRYYGQTNGAPASHRHKR